MSIDSPKTVFISYRRRVSAYIARAIYENLRANGYDVFMDVESIDSGEIDAIILRQIAARAHFLIICTPGTFERCSEPGDWIRREIEYALDTGRNLVPIFVDGFQFQDVEKHLTGKLDALHRKSGVPVYYEYFEEAVNRLRTRFLKQPVIGEIVVPPQADEPIVAAKQAQAESQPPPTPEQLLAEQHLLDGLSKFEDYDYEGAIADYDEALRLNSSSVEAYNKRGIAYEELKNIDRAIEDYTEAIRLDPTYAFAYMNRGGAYEELGDFDRAEQDQSEGIRLMPNSQSAYFSRARARGYKNDFDGAIADLSTAIRLTSEGFLSSHCYHMRANLYLMKGEFDAAIADFTAIIEHTDGLISAYMYRGYAKLQKRDFDGAISDANTAIEIVSVLPAPYHTRAEAYAKKGEYAAAIADYEKYLELGGGETDENRGEIEGKIRDLKHKLEKQQKS